MWKKIPTPQELDELHRVTHDEIITKQIEVIVTAMEEGRASCQCLEGTDGIDGTIGAIMEERGWFLIRAFGTYKWMPLGMKPSAP